MRAPSSVIIEDVGAPGADASKRRRICGVSWEIVVYTANSPEERRRSRFEWRANELNNPFFFGGLLLDVNAVPLLHQLRLPPRSCMSQKLGAV